MLSNCDIKIEFDDISKSYYIIWQPPVAIGSGNTRIQALRDLRKVAHFCVDSLIEQKLKETTIKARRNQ